MSGWQYIRPASVEGAIELLEAHGDEAHLLAGGTALTLLQKQGLVEPGVIVDLAAIPGLDGIDEVDGALVIGPMVTLRRVETDALVRTRVPALASTVGRVATIRVRNQATLGGNLVHADPAQDPPPILLALDAQVDLEGPEGTRTVPLSAFFVDVFETVVAPGEVLVRVRVPVPAPGARVGYEKFLPRTVDDYATVSVAARLDIGPDGTIGAARLALGGAASVPMRADSAEALLRGARVGEVDAEAVADAVREAVDPVGDIRGSADWKRDMAGVWARRLITRLATEGSAA